MSVTVEQAKSWINTQLADPYWMEAVNVAAEMTAYYNPIVSCNPESWDPHVEVYAEGSCECVRRYLGYRDRGEIPASSKIVLHNFADQKFVGGYFNKKTSGAQEENICSQTGLYGILLQHAKGHFGLYQEVQGWSRLSRNSHYIPMLYSPDVPIAMALGSTAMFGRVDILTAAMFNIRNEADKPANYSVLLAGQIESLMGVLNARDDDESDVYLITGAWGCGVFRNNPRDVYGEMKSHLKGGQDSRFHLVMAVPSGNNLFVAQEMFS